jgi:hypothetical protein
MAASSDIGVHRVHRAQALCQTINIVTAAANRGVVAVTCQRARSKTALQGLGTGFAATALAFVHDIRAGSPSLWLQLALEGSSRTALRFDE